MDWDWLGEAVIGVIQLALFVASIVFVIWFVKFVWTHV